MKLPVMRICEHNEAYICWDRMVREGHIAPTGNFLLHVDHHPDMEGGGYSWDFSRKPTGPEANVFTYQVLGIADFIQPALFYRIFSDVLILKNLIPVPIQSAQEIISCVDNSLLKRSKMIPFIHAGLDEREPERHSIYAMHEGGLGDVEQCKQIVGEKQIVLDVDLDYFCWDDSLSTRNPKRIEITADAYTAYQEDPHHFLKILPRRLLDVVEEDGKFYIEYREKLTPNKRPTRERILKRMDTLLKWLADCEITPAAIDICSSHISGYLPADMYPWIEEVFLEKLGQLWDLELI